MSEISEEASAASVSELVSVSARQEASEDYVVEIRPERLQILQGVLAIEEDERRPESVTGEREQEVRSSIRSDPINVLIEQASLKRVDEEKSNKSFHRYTSLRQLTHQSQAVLLRRNPARHETTSQLSQKTSPVQRTRLPVSRLLLL